MPLKLFKFIHCPIIQINLSKDKKYICIDYFDRLQAILVILLHNNSITLKIEENI